MSVVFPELCLPTMEIAGLGTLTIAATFACTFRRARRSGGARAPRACTPAAAGAGVRRSALVFAAAQYSTTRHPRRRGAGRENWPKRGACLLGGLQSLMYGRLGSNAGIMAARRCHERKREKPAIHRSPSDSIGHSGLIHPVVCSACMRSARLCAFARILLSTRRELPCGTRREAGGIHRFRPRPACRPRFGGLDFHPTEGTGAASSRKALRPLCGSRASRVRGCGPCGFGRVSRREASRNPPRLPRRNAGRRRLLHSGRLVSGAARSNWTRSASHPRSHGAALCIACLACRLGLGQHGGVLRRHGRCSLCRRLAPALRQACSRSRPTPRSRLQRTGIPHRPAALRRGGLRPRLQLLHHGVDVLAQFGGRGHRRWRSRQTGGIRHRLCRHGACAAHPQPHGRERQGQGRGSGRLAHARHASRCHCHCAGQPFHRLRTGQRPPCRSEPRALCRHRGAERSGAGRHRTHGADCGLPHPPRVRVDAARMRGEHGGGHGPFPAAGTRRPAGVALRVDAVSVRHGHRQHPPDPPLAGRTAGKRPFRRGACLRVHRRTLCALAAGNGNPRLSGSWARVHLHCRKTVHIARNGAHAHEAHLREVRRACQGGLARPNTRSRVKSTFPRAPPRQALPATASKGSGTW